MSPLAAFARAVERLPGAVRALELTLVASWLTGGLGLWRTRKARTKRRRRWVSYAESIGLPPRPRPRQAWYARLIAKIVVG